MARIEDIKTALATQAKLLESEDHKLTVAQNALPDTPSTERAYEGMNRRILRLKGMRTAIVWMQQLIHEA